MYAYIYCVVFWLFNIILAIHDLNNTPGQHDCSDDPPPHQSLVMSSLCQSMWAGCAVTREGF